MNTVITRPQRAAALTSQERNRLLAMGAVIAALHIIGFGLVWLATRGEYQLGDGSMFGWGSRLATPEAWADAVL